MIILSRRKIEISQIIDLILQVYYAKMIISSQIALICDELQAVQLDCDLILMP